MFSGKTSSTHHITHTALLPARLQLAEGPGRRHLITVHRREANEWGRLPQYGAHEIFGLLPLLCASRGGTRVRHVVVNPFLSHRYPVSQVHTPKPLQPLSPKVAGVSGRKITKVDTACLSSAQDCGCVASTVDGGGRDRGQPESGE
ncbi:hypothetical protein MAPG_02130 [Magnaporthiopsis poae ATCC 64411]|uniref:Uncharacterized protein n=1 Tax=Magnaporthiopsis poae (strain ATCC 64411 / 73-15) TaxID=644358 RepID=A0A0C4DQI7_MAGP6|nr:hypothetical protein MAPG_02130 [Magnaporthiopsis poae ATCC 64411]